MSWTVTSSSILSLGDRHTSRLVVSVAEAKPFVHGPRGFVNVASAADMSMLPEDSGTYHRTSGMDVLFRNEDMLERTLLKVEDDLEALQAALDATVPVSGSYLV